MFIAPREQKWSIAPLSWSGQVKPAVQKTSLSVFSTAAPHVGHLEGTVTLFASFGRFPSITLTT